MAPLPAPLRSGRAGDGARHGAHGRRRHRAPRRGDAARSSSHRAGRRDGARPALRERHRLARGPDRGFVKPQSGGRSLYEKTRGNPLFHRRDGARGSRRAGGGGTAEGPRRHPGPGSLEARTGRARRRLSGRGGRTAVHLGAAREGGRRRAGLGRRRDRPSFGSAGWSSSTAALPTTSRTGCFATSATASSGPSDAGRCTAGSRRCSSTAPPSRTRRAPSSRGTSSAGGAALGSKPCPTSEGAPRPSRATGTRRAKAASSFSSAPSGAFSSKPRRDANATARRFASSCRSGQALMANARVRSARGGTGAREEPASCPDTLDDDPQRRVILSGSYLHHVVRGRSRGGPPRSRTRAPSWASTPATRKIALAGRFMLAGALFHLGASWLPPRCTYGPWPRSARRTRGRAPPTSSAPRWASSSLVRTTATPCGSSATPTARKRRAARPSHAPRRSGTPSASRWRPRTTPCSSSSAASAERTWRQADAASGRLREARLSLLSLLDAHPARMGAGEEAGAVAEGRAGEMRDGLHASFRATGAMLRAPYYYLALQAAIALDAGDTDEARRLVAEGRATAERTPASTRHDAGLARLGELIEAGARR